MLLLTPDPVPEPEVAVWPSPDAVLSLALPVAVLPPVLAEALPLLETSASWSTMTTQPPVPHTRVVGAAWLTVVSVSLPVEPASPLVLEPSPPLVLLASVLSGLVSFWETLAAVSPDSPPLV
ncbi:MAG: hypothetical protein M3499_00735 [Actinomycetota bacterium]|nr:hypothetical protein [Actinomycetota bacterium]